MPSARSRAKAAVKTTVDGCEVLDKMISEHDGSFSGLETWQLTREWETNLRVEGLKARLQEVNIQYPSNANKDELVALLIEHRVPLGGGPILWSGTKSRRVGKRGNDREHGGRPGKRPKNGLDKLQRLEERLMAKLMRVVDSSSTPQPSVATDARTLRNVPRTVDKAFENASYVELCLLRDAVAMPDDEQFIAIGGSGTRAYFSSPGSRKKVTEMSEWRLLFWRMIQGYTRHHPSMWTMLTAHYQWIMEADVAKKYPEQALIDFSRRLRTRYQGKSADWSRMDMDLVALCLVPYVGCREEASGEIEREEEWDSDDTGEDDDDDSGDESDNDIDDDDGSEGTW